MRTIEHRTWGMDSDPADDWRAHAACRPGTGVDPELFFPHSPVSTYAGRRQIARAVAVCGHCPVIVECGRHALKAGITDGVWGGLDEGQRRKIAGGKSSRRLGSNGECKSCGKYRALTRRWICVGCTVSLTASNEIDRFPRLAEAEVS